MTWDLEKIIDGGVGSLLTIALPVAMGLLLIMQTAAFIIIKKEQSNGIYREKPFFPNAIWGALAVPYVIMLILAIINPNVSWFGVILYAILPPLILYFYVRYAMYIFYKPANVKGAVFNEFIGYVFLAPFLLTGKLGLLFFGMAMNQKPATTERWEITWSDGSKTHEDRTSFVGCFFILGFLILALAASIYAFILLCLPTLPGFAIVALYYFLRNFVLKKAYNKILLYSCGTALVGYFIFAFYVVLHAMAVF